MSADRVSAERSGAAAGVLGGLRVLDLSGITAGGRTTQLLGDFGADVIKVEGPRRPDPFRHWTGVTGESGDGDLDNPSFRGVNRNKRGLAVDLKDPRGVDVLGRLVARSDLVVENFRRGVMESLGIGFDRLREWNPRVVLLSISSQGDAGPERDYVSFGGTLEALGGLMSVTGYGPDEPTWTTSKVNFPDQAVALLAPGLAIAAVLRARATGRGVHVDLAQRETVVSLLGAEIAAASASGVVPVPRGNAVAGGLDLVVPVAGDDQWCAISVAGDGEWAALATELGHPEWGADPRFRDASARDAHREELVAEVAGAVGGIGKERLMSRLQRAGVAAAEVLQAWELEDRAGARGESLLVAVPAPGGVERQVSWPFVIEGAPEPAVRCGPPHVGEHDDEILAEAGYDAGAIAGLKRDGVIGIAAPEASTARSTR